MPYIYNFVRLLARVAEIYQSKIIEKREKTASPVERYASKVI